MGRGHRGKKKKPNQNSGDFFVQYYALAFIDILNQKEELRKITKLPETEEEEKEFIQKWKNTFGVVKGYRDTSDGFFNSFTKHYRDTFDDFFNSFTSRQSTFPSGMSKEGRDFVKLCGKVEIKKEWFSDTMIYYSSVIEKPDRLAITAIHVLLYGCASAFLLTLSKGYVCRGGIEVGIAGEFKPGDLYGPALYHAHQLESEDAEYPRIALGKGLIDFIAMEMNRSGQNIKDITRRAIATECKKWVTGDVDGVPILDYAGIAMKQISPDSNNILKDALDSAIDFVEREWNKFKQEGNTKLARKLASRYFLLLSYLMNRKQFVWK